jgi:hypothetical protein
VPTITDVPEHAASPEPPPPFPQLPYEQAPYEQAPYEQAPYEQAPYEQAPYPAVTFEPAPDAPRPLGEPPPRAPRRRAPLIAGLVVVVALCTVAGVVGTGLTGRGPLARLATRSAGGDRREAASPAPEPRHFAVGECAAGTGVVQVVPCGQAHVIEITAAVAVDDMSGAYPSATEWETIAGQRCLAPAEAYYGSRLDPQGRFSPGGLPPEEASWDAGDRQLWCGIEAAWTDHAGAAGAAAGAGTEGGAKARPATITGSVKGQLQFWMYRPGDCLGGMSPSPVTCTQPHELEVVGETSLDNRASVPPVADIPAWDKLVGSTCEKQAKSYLGRTPKAPWQVAWLAIAPGSWAAGKRNVTCVVGSGTRDGWTTVSSPAKSATSATSATTAPR